MSTIVPSRRTLLSRFFDDDAFGFPEAFLDDERFAPARLFERSLLKDLKVPAVNIKDHKDHFTIELAAPGYRKEDLKASVKDGVLTISSERKQEVEEEKEGYTRREFSCASFSRSFALPDHTDAESLKAKFADGVLRLTLKKNARTPESKAREIGIE